MGILEDILGVFGGREDALEQLKFLSRLSF